MEGVETITARRVYHYRVRCREFSGRRGKQGSFAYSVHVPHCSGNLCVLKGILCLSVCVSQVVMIKGETALDMRGRCSAGQKVWWLTCQQATKISFCLKSSLHPIPTMPIPSLISYTGVTFPSLPPLLSSLPPSLPFPSPLLPSPSPSLPSPFPPFPLSSPSLFRSSSLPSPPPGAGFHHYSSSSCRDLLSQLWSAGTGRAHH